MTDAATQPLGSVVALWRYPVKSMMGEDLNAVDVTARGLLGDRVYAIVDPETGKVASAKHPKKWPHMFDCRAAFVEPPRGGEPLPPVRVSLPQGPSIRSDEAGFAETLEAMLGRGGVLQSVAPEEPVLEEYWPDIEGLALRETVTEEAMPKGTFFDLGTVHLLTTATINRLRELYPAGRFEVRRFRPNIVVATAEGEPGFVENDWVGHTLAIGDTIRLRVTEPCPRCVMTQSSELEMLGELGLRALAIDPTIERDESDDWQARGPAGALRRRVAVFARRARAEIKDMQRALAEERPDALLIDPVTWGAAVVAEASGLPWATFAHFPLPIASKDAPPFGPGFAPRHDWIGRARDALVRRLVLARLERVALAEINPLRASFGLAPLRDATEAALAATLVLFYSAEPLEYPRSDWPPSLRLVGPGIWEPPAEPPSWLERIKQPLVLVTCSSEFQNDHVLGQVALEALADEPVEVVVTTAGFDPSRLNVPANARVERFLPHLPLIHRAACVVCHGGAGITHKALAAGVPVCVVPFGRDQPEIARRVVVSDAGTSLSARRLRPDRLRAAVQAAMTKKPGAERIAAAFAAAGGAAAAADALEELVVGPPAAATLFETQST